jgi:hypothetical protein
MVLAYLRLYPEGVHESEGVELGDPADSEKQTNHYKVASPPPPDKEDLRFKAAQNLSTKEWEWFPGNPPEHRPFFDTVYVYIGGVQQRLIKWESPSGQKVIIRDFGTKDSTPDVPVHAQD